MAKTPARSYKLQKPYLKDNVQVVVYMYNVCKAEFAHADVVQFCKAVASSEAEIV